jgi:hypothetical protein
MVPSLTSAETDRVICVPFVSCRLMSTLRILSVVLLSLCLVHGTAILAQEGHPLKGSWVGAWGPSRNHSDDLFIVMNWDGTNITKLLDPGTDDRPIKNATLNPDGWIVRFEADGTDGSGKLIRYILEGKLESLGSPRRYLVGTWKSEEEGGRFKTIADVHR